MRKMMSTAAALVFAAGAVTVAGATQAQAGTSATYHGCPDGYVCMYPDASWNNDRPSHKWYTYGAHNLSNVYGVHRIVNNQTGGATMQTCTGYNGTGCEGYLPGGGWSIDKNMTPINSIRLNRP